MRGRTTNAAAIEEERVPLVEMARDPICISCGTVLDGPLLEGGI